VPHRTADRSRFFIPLILSAILFAVYLPFRRDPLMVPGFGDVRAYLQFAAYAALIFFIVRFIDTLVFDLVMRRRRHVAAPQLLRGIVAIVLYALLLTSAFSTVFNIDIKAYLTATTVIAAVIALALQDTLGNLFSGISLHMEQTYEVGDVIHSGEYMGVVEGVSWRATRMRGFNNQVVVLPNSVIARERLEIFPRNNLNARVISVAVDYHVPPATVIGILMQAASHVDGVARERPSFARVAAFGDSAVAYEIKYFTRDYSARDRIDADIRKAVWYALRRNNIEMPFPIRAFRPYTPPTTEPHVSPEEIVKRLRQVDVLDPVPDAALETIAIGTRMHFYSKGEAILRHGTVGDSMFVVHSGMVVVRLPDDSLTGWHQVAQLGPGGVFGEMALLTGEMRAADVVAFTDVVALEIGKESLQPILNSHPDLAGAISHQIMARREHLDSIRDDNREQDEQTLISRIRSYFGI
jgi:small-conductance mechanosensitive channel/CRP-like cAMP-binding protein